MKITKKPLRLLILTIFAIAVTIMIVMILKSITKHYILIMGILALLINIFYPQFRGFMGEFWVKQELKKLPKDEYKVLNNIMVKRNNMTYQIDHLVISHYGIFVIEMKNYYGLIIGKDSDDKWIQYLGKKKSYFKNPIHQNYGHVKALEELLNFDKKIFIPIVCFSNQVTLKIETNNDVVLLDYLISNIKSHQNIVLENNLETIQEKIIELNITNKVERKNHINNIKNKIAEDNAKIENMICPKCGGKLIARNGQYGPFLGCSNYPRCKFIKKI